MNSIEERINKIREEFPKTNLLMTFTVNKNGAIKLFKVIDAGADKETDVLLQDEAENEASSKQLRELRGYIG